MDSDILRWLLLIIAVIALAIWYMGHWFANRRSPVRSNKTGSDLKKESQQESAADPLLHVDEKDTVTAAVEVSADSLLILSIDCRDNQEFRGADVIDMLVTRGLTLGKYSIYHRYIQSEGSERLVYSVINGVEPGYLNEDFSQSTTPSLMFFIDLDQSYNPMRAFSEMLEAANVIADHLDGLVCNSDHSALTEQTIGYMKETIREKERSQHLQVIQ